MTLSVFLLSALFLPAALSIAADNYADAVNHFSYDASAPLAIKEIGVEDHGGIQVHDITYAGGKGTAPAYLVVPSGKGPFAAILWGHWMMPGSPNKGRKEFVDEAVILAKSGVVSLLIDSPMVRAGYVKQDDPSDMRDDVIDLRRGLDLLLARKDVDPNRIAYVGHSFHAATGAILAGVDKRPKAFVLMAGALDYSQYLVSEAPDFVNLRKKMPVEKLRAALDQVAWSNPCQFATHAAPAVVLLQNGSHDEFMTVADIEHYNSCVSTPKEAKLYDAGHALNPEAAKDRDQWLQKQLGLKSVDIDAISKLPQLK